MKRGLGIIWVIAALSSACSDYSVILKGDDYSKKFSTANELYEKSTKTSFGKAIVLYEQVFQHAPKTAEGELSYFLMAKSYFGSGDYYMAGYFFGSYVQRYPYSQRNEEVFFLAALCSVNNSPKWSLDQTETYAAINAVQEFIDKYPKSVLVDSCNKILDDLSYKLEFKDYNKVLLYDKTENFKAAVSYSDFFTENYPLSIHDEEIRYIGVKNAFYLAQNSIESKKRERIEETIARYRTFVSDFPASEYVKSLQALLKIWENDYEF